MCAFVDSGGINGLLGNVVGTAEGLLDGTVGIAGNSLDLAAGRQNLPFDGMGPRLTQVLD